jgi:FkbH-like protein
LSLTSHMSARTRPNQAANSSVCSEADDRLSKVIDAAIGAAPECIRARTILPSVDWEKVAAPTVESLLASLKQARVSCPRWLSKSLVVAGHVLGNEIDQNLVGQLKILHRLNRACRQGERGADIGPLLVGLLDYSKSDGEVVNALVARLMELGREEDAARLALANAHQDHDALRKVGAHIISLTGKMPSVRLRLASFSATEILAEALHPAFAAAGWRAEVYQCDFGTVLSELMSPQGDCDALVVLLDFEGFAPVDWRNSPDQAAELLNERIDCLASALKAFAERSDIPVLINTIPCTSAPMAGLLDRQHAMGLRRAVDSINARIVEAAAQSPGIVVVDSDVALGELPLSRHIECKLWFYGRIAYSVDATHALGRAFAQTWRLLRRGPIKVVAVDLDNTLWGGVYGDDGVDNLACGQDFPGNAFLAMQQECLRLRSQGLLLVALSKNYGEAVTAFERHPGMAIRPADFSATAVNWDPKPQNIRRVAAELNLGLDSFLFIDDSPQEREAMRLQCPEVVVPEVPTDPAERPLWLRRLVCTWPVRMTAEDQSRQSLYAAGKEVGKWKAVAGSHEDFLKGLEQRLTVAHLRPETIARIAQMHQRTNQFNLTTVRYTESDIAAMASADWTGTVLHGRVRDRFGDHGIVIASVVSIDEGEAEIRSYLMSCRVIGREVERAFLGELLRELARRGVNRVNGQYIPTAKNGMVRDFFATCGFENRRADESGSTWSLNLTNMTLPGSQFVTTEWET